MKEDHFSFSLLSYVFPRWSKDEAYNKAIKFVNQYMDLRTLIEKLQDIDRIKYIIFDKKQRKVFDNLPKVELGSPTKMKSSVTSSKRLSFIGLTKVKKEPTFLMNKIDKYKFLLNGEQTNQRLYELLQFDVQEKLNIMK